MRSTEIRRRLVAFLLATVLVVISPACSRTGSPQATTAGPEPAPTATPDDSTGDTPATATTDSRELLAPLAIDDRPHTASDYRRDAWHHWDDLDGDGCDARQQALEASSTRPPQVDDPCKVRSGHWVSAYDGFTTTDPGDLDVDHIVPLENAHRSGGWAWTAEQRRRYANDRAGLWVVSASSNRSKGASSPDRWRPPSQGVWCDYAQRWTSIKVRWALSATTAERDALGRMLDTCPAGTLLSRSPPASGTPSASLPTTAAPPRSDGGEPYYANCAAARAAGAAPIQRGDAGYRAGLDRDANGIACE